MSAATMLGLGRLDVLTAGDVADLEAARRSRLLGVELARESPPEAATCPVPASAATATSPASPTPSRPLPAPAKGHGRACGAGCCPDVGGES